MHNPMSFDFDRFGNTEDIPKEVTESFDVNKMPEVMFLSKFIGDFNIQPMATNIYLRPQQPLCYITSNMNQVKILH